MLVNRLVEYFDEDMESLHELDDTPGIHFDPQEIIWCRYKFETSIKGPTELIISRKVYRYDFTTSDKFKEAEQFAIAVAGGKDPDGSGSNTKVWDYTLISGDKPSDAGVAKQCFVVIELSADQRWKFRTSGPGITTKNKHTTSNFNNRHVSIGSVIGKGIYPEDCRVLYFAVVFRAGNCERQKFNFHVEMISGQAPGTYAIGVVIDPDIRNTGNLPIPAN